MSRRDKVRASAEECWLAIQGPWVPVWERIGNDEADQIAAEIVRARDYVTALERLAAEIAAPSVAS